MQVPRALTLAGSLLLIVVLVITYNWGWNHGYKTSPAVARHHTDWNNSINRDKAEHNQEANPRRPPAETRAKYILSRDHKFPGYREVWSDLLDTSLHNPSLPVFVLFAGATHRLLSGDRLVKALNFYKNTRLRHLNVWSFVELCLLVKISICARLRPPALCDPVSIRRSLHGSRSCLRDLQHNYVGNNWGNDGSGVLTRRAKKLCNTTSIQALIQKSKRCQGFTVFDPRVLYAVPYWEWKDFFDRKKFKETMEKVSKSPVVHVWNEYSKAWRLNTIEISAYTELAKKNSPRSFAAAGKMF